jgi:hypothetical protein
MTTPVAIEIYDLITKGRFSDAITRIKAANKSDVEALKKLLTAAGLWAGLDAAVKNAINAALETKSVPSRKMGR